MNSGQCECGCGKITSIASKTDKSTGHVKGEHFRFLAGHQNRGRSFGRRSSHLAANPRGLCMCGCGEKTNIAKSTDASVGAVAGSPLKYVLGHNRRKSPTAYRVDAATGCWVWQRATTKSGGYGQIRVGGRIQMAHRYYYEKHVGPIPAGLHIDHLCKNTVCVNPSHLEPVTQAENNRRSRL